MSLLVIIAIIKFVKLNFSFNSQLHYSKSIMYKKSLRTAKVIQMILKSRAFVF